MLGLSMVDFVVVLIYVVGITWIGVRSGRGVKTSGEYFMPRRFGKWMLTMATFSTGTSSDQATTVASKCFTSGASGIWYQWLFMFATPFFWLVMPLLRRFRAITVADIFEARFDRSVGHLFCIAGLLKCALSVGLLLKGTGALIESASGSTMNSHLILVLLTISLLAYSLVGGLTAAIIAESFQGLLIIVFSFLLLPSVLHAVGGIHGMKLTLDNPARFTLFEPGEIGVFHVTMLTVSSLAMLVMIPENLGLSSASRREEDGQVGFVCGAFIKRVCTVAWCLIGLGGAAYFLDRPVNPDHIYGLLAREFLPSLLPGLLGLFIASVLATSMSTCSPILVAAAALFTKLYRAADPARSEARYIAVGRCAMVGVAGVGMSFAFLFPGVVKGLEIMIAITPVMGITFWMGFFWKRTTTPAVWLATGAGYATWAFCSSAWGVEIVGGMWPGFVKTSAGGGSVAPAWEMLFIFITTIGTAVAVSVATRPVDSAQLERFFALSRTPVRLGEVILQPCTLPEGAVVPEPRLWIDWGNLQIPSMGRRAKVGFLICCAGVAFLVIGFQRILAL
jgi:Na+/proline symporter